MILNSEMRIAEVILWKTGEYSPPPFFPGLRSAPAWETEFGGSVRGKETPIGLDLNS